MKARDFQHKNIVVTGAASGLGRALSLRFSEAGARVCGLDVDGVGLQETGALLEQSKADWRGIVCDITDPQKVQETFETFESELGGVDLLINNAGISHRSEFSRTKITVFQRIIEINLLGAIHCTHAAIQSLIARKGMIIAVSSVAGFAPLIARTGYAASKHGMHGFFESLRSEVGDLGVDILMVYPSFINTNIIKNALGADGKAVQHEQAVIGGRLEPHQAAEQIFAAASKAKRKLVLGATGKLSWWTYKFFPRIYERGMIRQLNSELQR